jgi:hypothetical protein
MEHLQRSPYFHFAFSLKNETVGKFTTFYNSMFADAVSRNTSAPKEVYYHSNYANLFGGAKIVMKSSERIKEINAILSDSVDQYLYTDEKLPIQFIIGLNEEIAISSVILQSEEMYSCITKEFRI